MRTLKPVGGTGGGIMNRPHYLTISILPFLPIPCVFCVCVMDCSEFHS